MIRLLIAVVLLVQAQLYHYDYHMDIEYQHDNMDSKVTITTKMQLEQYGSLFALTMDNLTVQSKDDQYSEDKGYPVVFTMQDGLVKDVYIVKQEAEWVANLKRGAISSFQVEQGQDVTGQSTFSFDRTDNKIVRTKQFDRSGSSSIQTYEVDGSVYQSYESVDEHGMDDLDFKTKVQVKTLLAGKEELENRIESIGDLLNYVGARYQLPEDALSQSSLLLQQTEGQNDLRQFGESDVKDEMLDEKLAQVMDMAEKVSINRQLYSSEFLEIVQMLQTDGDLLKNVIGLVDSDIKLVIVDALIATGLDEAFKLLRESTAFDMKDEKLINRMLVDLAYVPATWDMFDFALKIIEDVNAPDVIKDTAALSLGSMVRKTGEVRMYRYAWHCLWRLEQQLKSATQDDQKILYLHAIGNAGKQPSIHVVEPFVVNQQESDQVRHASVFAMRHMEPKDAKYLMIKAYNDISLPTETRVMAFEFMLPVLNEQEKETILSALIDEGDEVVKIRVWQYLGVTVQASDAWFERSEEVMVAGTKKLNAVVGYAASLYNPFSPHGVNKTVGHGETYVDVNAFSKRANIFRGVIRLQGDLLSRRGGRNKPAEAFLYISVGGTVWSECLDIFGNACGRTSSSKGRCQDVEKVILDFSAVLFRIHFTIPIIVGVGLRLDQQFVSSSFVLAKASGCKFPFSGKVDLLPDVGVSAVAQASINLFVVRTGARLNAKILNTKVSSNFKLDATKLPVTACTTLNVDQKKVKGVFQMFIQFRKIRWCRKFLPCGFPWGKERLISKGFAVRQDKSQQIIDKCWNLGLRRPKLSIQK